MTARLVNCKESNGSEPSSIDRCLVKLKRMVPTLRGKSKVKKLDLLQHVIDYIQDLESILTEDAVPASPSSSSTEIGISVRS